MTGSDFYTDVVNGDVASINTSKHLEAYPKRRSIMDSEITAMPGVKVIASQAIDIAVAIIFVFHIDLSWNINDCSFGPNYGHIILVYTYAQ